ncbi:MAG: hypothetical protein HFI11_12935 [Lachnospiraceae bacterium]|nr:hypothetical protein [Lachnospiraceae bacterium]
MTGKRAGGKLRVIQEEIALEYAGGEEERPGAAANWCRGYGFGEIPAYQPPDKIDAERQISTP